MEANIYLSACPRCRAKTEHLVYLISRIKGVRLKCSVCGKIKNRFYNLKYLELKQNEK